MNDPDRVYVTSQFGPKANQKVINLCQAKAEEAGKLDEFLDAVTMYRNYVTRQDALAIVALARVGLDPKAAETVFMMGLQEERREDEARMGMIQRNLEMMARGFALAPHTHLDFSLAAGEDGSARKKP